MATLGELHENVRLALKKGTTLDDVIPSRVRRAAHWIERNRTYQYMKRIGQISIDRASEFPWVVEVPNPNWKSIDLVRIVLTDGTICKLDLDPSFGFQVVFPNGRPTKYSLDGVERLVLNANPTEDFYIEIFWSEYTSWPTDLSSTNFLLTNAEDLLEYQTLLYMALFLRDERMASTYASGRDEALRTLELEEDERVNTNTNLRMDFIPEGGRDWPQEE